MVRVYSPFYEFLRKVGSGKEKRKKALTVIVNLLYGNNVGMRLKKWSSYSSSFMANNASCAS